MKSKKKKKINLIVKSISQGINFVAIVVLFVLLYLIKKSNMMPTKYMTLIILATVIPLALYTLMCYIKNPKKGILIVMDLIAIPAIFVEFYGITKINETINWLKGNFTLGYNTDSYYVIVNKNSSYDKIEDIKGKTVYYYDDFVDYDKLNNALNENVKAELKKAESNDELITTIKADKKYIVLMHASFYDSLTENDPDFKDKTKIISSDVMIKEKIKKKEKELPDVLKEPFVIYLSGIDTRNGDMPARGLSDVNMVIVVNPLTHKVLMVNIPRDYYVQLHGTTGLKDKLTHAGVNGGVDLSIATIQDILGVEIDYYLRVNFNAVVNLVDAIGGLTINSDVNYSFTCWTDSGCVIHPGDNNVGGRCALAFARERHAYETGDRHRGENQQQVISLIMDKVGSSKELLNNYSNILKALDGTFETTFSDDKVSDLIRHQLDKMPHWEVITSNLDGSGAMEYTYSYPNQKLSVMIPDQSTIETAKQKINEILNEK